MEEPDFWLDPDKSTRIVQEMKTLKSSVEAIENLETQYEEIQILLDMGYEENDASVIPEIEDALKKFGLL